MEPIVKQITDELEDQYYFHAKSITKEEAIEMAKLLEELARYLN